MSWNPVLNKFIEIKNEYINQFGSITYDYKSGYTNESETCLERWVRELNNINSNDYKEYEDILSCLELNQYNNMLLFRYGRYSHVYDCEIDVSGDDLWERYDGFYRECRSVVIDVEKNCLILTPFSKFFNLNELEETSLENIQEKISKASVIEFSDKLDGSMQSARWYDGKIIMAGSQAVNPESSWRLTDGYKMINDLNGYKDMLRLYPECTFIFEYISLRDAHVIKYTKEQEGLYLIGIRNTSTGKDYDYLTVISVASLFNIPTTKLFNKTLEQVMDELDDKPSSEAEGFVINIDGYKVKLKYNDYVHIHKALSKLSSINLIIRSIADDTYDDLLSKLPHAYHDQVNRVAKIVFNYIRKTEATIREYYNEAPKVNRKDFMIYVSKNVPKKYQGYVKEYYLGKKINVIKRGDGECAHYKKLKEMGVVNYNEIFME